VTRINWTTGAVRVAPDLVIEILSRSTAKRDLHAKFVLYERNGVKEYWVVFPWDKAIDIYALDEGHKFSIAGQYQYPNKVKVEKQGDGSLASFVIIWYKG
jgi:Uma2 family endonuclease